ncbi:MAG: trimethylamine methyltransferase family protein [Anaerolineales bacterium]|nr:trimethylamine methyltransferase family protein [Anaerolineales bacterium]
MPSETPALEPIKTDFRMNFVSDQQLDDFQEATLQVLEEIGVQFPSQKALDIFNEHGAHVDLDTQIVKIPRQMVKDAMAKVPRTFVMGARDPEFDLQLQEGVSYFTTDGCGYETIDIKSGERRASTKADVGMMARITDYLSSIGFYWPMVSAQDYGVCSPLHELDATWNNSVKHIQSETLMGARPAEFGVEMATVLRGSREEVRRRPPFSVLICTIAPLMQDKEGIEGALVLAEAGIPVGFLSMPTLGTTSPATFPGAMVVGDAEVISATVLMQLATPGAAVFHSIMQAWADPRNAAYVGYPLDTRGRYTPVEIAHHWGMPAFGGAFGTDGSQVDGWQSATEVALDPFMIGLSGCEIVTGMGLRETYTLLYPEAIMLDDDIYHRARYALMEMDVNPETLALDVIGKVGPGGHFLAQKHTRKHMRHSLQRSITQQLDAESNYLPALDAAREKFSWIYENHHPEPLDAGVQKELTRILEHAGKELE